MDKKDMPKYAMISQPMDGKMESEIENTIKLATESLNKLGYEVIDTYLDSPEYSIGYLAEQGIVNAPVLFLAKSIEFMSKCSAVYFCRGWENARGCKLEHDIAERYGIPIIYSEYE